MKILKDERVVTVEFTDKDLQEIWNFCNNSEIETPDCLQKLWD